MSGGGAGGSGGVAGGGEYRVAAREGLLRTLAKVPGALDTRRTRREEGAYRQEIPFAASSHGCSSCIELFRVEPHSWQISRAEPTQSKRTIGDWLVFPHESY